MTRLEPRYLPTATVIVVALLVWVLSASGVAASDMYTDSAHGNTTYGVNRSDAGYETGDCAHCHDTFDDSLCGENQAMLFYGWIDKCNLFCYQCHVSSDGEMQVDNYLYCMNFGGLTKTWPGIYKQFCAPACENGNCGSRHDLGAIYNLINNDPYGWGSPPVPNPCWACHNTHLAQRIGAAQHHPPYDPTKSCITRPSERYNNPSNPLWGDDASERMDQYAASVDGHYQAPYYGDISDANWELSYEPAGTASPSDGSNLPDYVTFCMDCHQYTQYDPERSQTVKVIEWGPPWCTTYNADKHGAHVSGDYDGTATYEQGNLRAPYDDIYKENGYNYVLSCTDCHEPHGSPYRVDLIRRFVNGEDVSAGTQTGGCYTDDDYEQLCGRCHTNTHDLGGCFVCHSHGIEMYIGGEIGTTPLF